MLAILFMLPLLLSLMILPMAVVAARLWSPTPPRDGSPGPWCARCRYSLSGVATTALCPECDGDRRLGHPEAVPSPVRWVVVAMAASVVSHAPLLIARFAHVQVWPTSHLMMAAQAFLAGAVMTILIGRMHGRVLVWAIAALALPHIFLDVVTITVVNSPSLNIWAWAFGWLPLLHSLLPLASFGVFTIFAALRARRARRTPLRAK